MHKLNLLTVVAAQSYLSATVQFLSHNANRQQLSSKGIVNDLTQALSYTLLYFLILDADFKQHIWL